MTAPNITPNATWIIVTWNVRSTIEACLRSLFQAIGASDRVIIVDNASRDGTIENLRHLTASMPSATLITNTTNRGFAAAVNQALRYEQQQITAGWRSPSSMVILLNPDTEVIPGFADKAEEWFAIQPNVGILGGRILNPDGSLQRSLRRFPTLASQVLILTKLAHLFPNTRTLQRYWAQDLDYTKAQTVDQIMGAFFCIRRECLNAVGHLDEQYFVWFEEVDYAKRARDQGWSSAYIPVDCCRHRQAQSFDQWSSLKRQWHFTISCLRYFRKHHSSIEWPLLVLLTPVGLIVSVLILPFSRPS